MVEKTDLIDFLFGRGSGELNQRIMRELREQPDGEIVQFFKTIHERTRNVLNVDWSAVKGQEQVAKNGGETLNAE